MQPDEKQLRDLEIRIKLLESKYELIERLFNQSSDSIIRTYSQIERAVDDTESRLTKLEGNYKQVGYWITLISNLPFWAKVLVFVAFLIYAPLAIVNMIGLHR